MTTIMLVGLYGTEQALEAAWLDRYTGFGLQGREILPVQPRVVMQGETARILLPGEPGYE